MNEVTSLVEVVNSCLHVNSYSIIIKYILLENFFLALNIR